jgi:hypothetical protein
LPSFTQLEIFLSSLTILWLSKLAKAFHHSEVVAKHSKFVLVETSLFEILAIRAWIPSSWNLELKDGLFLLPLALELLLSFAFSWISMLIFFSEVLQGLAHALYRFPGTRQTSPKYGGFSTNLKGKLACFWADLFSWQLCRL